MEARDELDFVTVIAIYLIFIYFHFKSTCTNYIKIKGIQNLLYGRVNVFKNACSS